jgi:membrane fusion protein, multidrug efflux system
MKRVPSATLLLAALALFLVGCSDSKPTVAAGALTASASTLPPPQPAPEFFTASGPLVVENQIDVAAEREGVVAKVMAEPGLRVKKGQLLAQLDDRQLSADLEAARAKTGSAEADLKNWQAEAKVLESDYQRAQKMWDAQLITKEQLEHARYKAESDQWDVKRAHDLLKNAQATARSTELELEKTRIRAPFDGLVARRYVRAGQKVALGDRLFWVTAEAPLRVKFTLPEQFLGKVKKGQELAVSPPSDSGRSYAARVIEVSPVVDPASGTIEVLAELLGKPEDLRPGLTASVRLPNPR